MNLRESTTRGNIRSGSNPSPLFLRPPAPPSPPPKEISSAAERAINKRAKARDIVRQFKALVEAQDPDFDDIIEWQVATAEKNLQVLSVYVDRGKITLDVQ